MSKAPEAKATKEKPDNVTHCPASGNKLRLKDLVDVKFTPVPEGRFTIPTHAHPVSRHLHSVLAAT